MANHEQWEYKLIGAGTFWTRPKDDTIEGILNELGVEGWEVFSVYTQHGSNKVWIVSKRPVNRPARRPRHWPE